jgi:hypothetical protein
MTTPRDNKRDALARAQKQFGAADKRDAAFKEHIARERAALTAKDARLKELRLAKDATDREAAAKAAAEAPPKPVRKAKRAAK